MKQEYIFIGFCLLVLFVNNYITFSLWKSNDIKGVLLGLIASISIFFASMYILIQAMAKYNYVVSMKDLEYIILISIYMTVFLCLCGVYIAHKYHKSDLVGFLIPILVLISFKMLLYI